MNRIFKRTKWIYILAIAFFATLIVLFITMDVNADKWVVQDYNQYLYSDGEMIGEGSISDRNGVTLVKTENGKRVYNDSSDVRKATLHVVGDSEGFISTGAQTAFKSKLTGYNLFNGLYGLSEDDQYDLQLSIDSELSVTAMNALGSYHGTVGVYNYETGEILCAVSMPTYDVENKPNIDENDSSWSGVYMNRFFSSYFTPGSTFKIVTSACALENVPNIESQTFTCPGYFETSSGSKVKCSSTHGTITFQQGLNRSCNTEFAEIAAEQLTNDELMTTAEEFGYNKSINVDGIKCKASYIDLSDAYEIDRAWAGIGQYTTLVNPCHEITVLGAIANGNGKTPNPTILLDSANRTSDLSYMSSSLAGKLNNLLRSDVTDYYTDSRFPNLSMCGKTGTAEVSNKEPHTWFVGYSQRSDLPLAIVVVLENSGGSGIGTAIPVANTVMQKALSLYVK